MKRLVGYCAMLGIALSCVFVSSSPVAAQSKPMAIVALSGVDEIVGDVKYIMETAGQAQVANIVEVSVGGFTQGIDTKRPVCISVAEENGQIQVLGMVPVTDLKKMVTILSTQIGQPRDVGDGVLEFAGPATIYIKEQKGWAFVTNSQEGLSTLPADPLALVGGLEKKYDIALKGVIKNIPQALKDRALQQMQAGVEAQLANADSDAEREAQKKMMDIQMNNWKTMMAELDELTLGINVDRSAESVTLDVTEIALPGTKTAKQLSKLKDAVTNFSGFHADRGAANVHIVGEIAPEDIESTLNAILPAKEQALKEIQEDDDIKNDEARKLATSLVERLFGIIEETIKTGKMDGGATLSLDDQKLTFISGMYVADGKKFEAAIDEVIALGKNEPNFPGIKKNADKIGNVALHTMSIPVPDHEEEARKFLGEVLDVAVGIGEKSVYVAFGNNCVAQLKGAIQSSQSSKKLSTPVHMNIAMGPILDFASHFEENPVVSAMAEAFKAHAGSDSIVMSGQGIENGAVFRLEIQSGVMKSIGSVTSQAQPAGAGF